MKIIDKNNDFYDFMQDPTDNRLVFDRRGSFLLTKEFLCKNMRYYIHRSGAIYPEKDLYHTILLHCGAQLWLFLLTYSEEEDSLKYPKDCSIELLTSWKNYDIPHRLLTIGEIYPDISPQYDFKTRKYKDIHDGIESSIEHVKYSIDHNDHVTFEPFINKKYISFKNDYKTEEQIYPILRSCGIDKLINPVEIFCSIEEYFSMEKTSLETTEPKGATNDDKIIMHGFDTKSSFRGKQK